MRQLKIHLNHITVLSREDKKNPYKGIGVITNQFKSSSPVEITFDAFCKHVLQGKGFVNCIFNEGTKAKAEILESNLIALDFDNQEHYKDPDRPYLLSSSDFLSRCESIGIYPNLVYHSPSSSPELEKYRAVFVLSEPCMNWQKLETFLHLFRDLLFPECDKKSAEPSQFFYGGKSLVQEWNSIDTINIENLDQMVYKFCLNKTPKYAAQTLNRLFDNFLPKLLSTNTLYLDFLPEISQEISKWMESNPALCENKARVTYSHVPQSHTSTPKGQKKSVKRTPEVIEYVESLKRSKNNFKFKRYEKELKISCPLLGDYDRGIKIPNDLIAALTSNLYYMSGGEEYMIKTMEEVHIPKGNNARGKAGEIVSTCKSIKRYDYAPYSCASSGCPYFSTCERRGSNILSQTGFKEETKIYKIEDYQPVILDSTSYRIKQNETLNQIYTNPSTRVTAYRAETGSGKTKWYLDAVREGKIRKCLVALPRHSNLDEVSVALGIQRGKMQDGKFVAAKQTKFKNKFRLAEYEEDREKSLAREKSYYYEAEMLEFAEDIEHVQNLQLDLDKVDNVRYSTVTFTTHADLSNRKDLDSFDTIIIDEDFDSHSLHEATIKLSDLTTLMDIIEHDYTEEKRIQLLPIFNYLKSTKGIDELEYRIPVKQTGFTIEEWKAFIYSNKNKISSPVVNLVKADLICKTDEGTISLSWKTELFPNHKVMILSATIEEEITKMQYGEEISFVDIGDCEKKQELIQYSANSFSVDSINQLDRRDKLGEIINSIDATGSSIAWVACPLKAEDRIKVEFPKGTDIIHFGATSGVNYLSGKNGIIYGTPYPSPELVKLLYATWTGDLETVNTKLKCKIGKNIKVVHRGAVSKMTLFENEKLRAIQLYLIKKEIFQTIGRGRGIDHDVKIFIFSNFPIGYDVKVIN